MTTKNTLEADLIAAIRDERRTFRMELYHRGDEETQAASCETACCMAGHIEALRPELAARFLSQCMAPVGFLPELNHKKLARKIWKHETGEVCLLDFTGRNTNLDLEEISRDYAIEHILGENDDWEQLDEKDVDLW